MLCRYMLFKKKKFTPGKMIWWIIKE
jgi:hypothetical protein